MKNNKTAFAVVLLIAFAALSRAADLVVEWDAVKAGDVQRHELRLVRTDTDAPEKIVVAGTNGANIEVKGLRDGVWDVDLVAVRTKPPASDGRPELCWRRIIISRKTVMVFGAKKADGPWRLLGDVVDAPVHLRLWPRSEKTDRR